MNYALTRRASFKFPGKLLYQECFNSPYGTQYFADYAEEIPGESTNMLSSVAKETKCYIIGGSIPERDSGKLYNTSTSFGPDGTLLAKHRKVSSNLTVVPHI